MKRDIMIRDYKNEDLRMIDIRSFNKALTSTWVKMSELLDCRSWNMCLLSEVPVDSTPIYNRQHTLRRRRRRRRRRFLSSLAGCKSRTVYPYGRSVTFIMSYQQVGKA